MFTLHGSGNWGKTGLVNVTIMSIESDILREIDFAVAIEKGVWPLNVDCVGRYNRGGRPI